MINLFDKGMGWVDWPSILSVGMPYNICYGGRGIGKTYGALKYIITETDLPFMFIRRTQKQLNTITVPKLSPFIKLANDLDMDIKIKLSSKTETGTITINGEERGIAGALSTFANLRGMDSDAEFLLYDEFIPERSERKLIKDEGDAVMNMLETIIRNRELIGRDPMTFIAIANANDIGNSLFMELGLVTLAQRMKEKHQELYINKDRGLLFADLENSPISEKKKETSLYKLVDKNSSFYKMAIGNVFIDDSIAIIKSRNLKEYVPLVSISELTFYSHKTERKFYLSEHYSGSPEIYSTASADIERFQKNYYYLWNAYLNREIEFENKLCAVIFDKLF